MLYWIGLYSIRSGWIGSDCIGLDWIVSDGIVLHWIVLHWIVLDRSFRYQLFSVHTSRFYRRPTSDEQLQLPE